MLDIQEIIIRLKTFLGELEDCQSKERLKEIKKNIDDFAEKLEVPDKDIRGVSHLIYTIKQVLGCNHLDKEEIDYIMHEIGEAIQKLEEMSK